MIWLWIIIGIAAFAGISFAGMFFATKPIGRKLYDAMLRRSDPDMWQRANSCPENEEQCVMYDAGMAWAAENAAFMREVSVTNDSLRLAGEYYDFGFRRAAIIIPGRAETLNYSYYFAHPYKEAGCNVLVIDPRAHGLSEGSCSTVGVRESRDVLAWARLLHDDLGNSEVYLHGICIGACTAVLAAASEAAPGYLSKIAVEGPYTTFYEIFRQRTKNQGHPAFPLMLHIRALMKKHAGADMKTEAAPVKKIGGVHIPMLVMYSRMDTAVPEKRAKQVIAACDPAHTRVVWFDKGDHSHIRVNNTAAYDSAVISFING